MKFLIWIAIGAALWWYLKKTGPTKKSMSKAEAAHLLGLSDKADRTAIIEAHKRLIIKVHPDAGGTPELASQINRARDILLSSLQQ